MLTKCTNAKVVWHVTAWPPLRVAFTKLWYTSGLQKPINKTYTPETFVEKPHWSAAGELFYAVSVIVQSKANKSPTLLVYRQILETHKWAFLHQMCLNVTRQKYKGTYLGDLLNKLQKVHWP